jgi:hypothetical protein
MVIDLPSGTDAGYSAITVAGRINVEKHFTCNPDKFGEKRVGVDMERCNSADLKWRISGELLRGGRSEIVKIATPDDGILQTAGMVMSLSGERIGPLAQPTILCWCTPEKCTEKELADCRVAATR